MGVDLFFVLSGFLITGILVKCKDQSFGRYIGGFYARRARRILPAYIAIMLIATFAYGSEWAHHWYLYFGAMNFIVPLHISGLPGPMWSIWSLAVEEQFYLLWPLAIFYLSPKQTIKCGLFLLALAPVLRFVCTPLFDDHLAIYMLLPFRMDTLAAGALIALLWPQVKDKVLNYRPILSGGIVVILGLSLLAIRWLALHGFTTDSNTRVGNFGVYEATLVIATSVFLLALMGIGKPILSFAPLRWLGMISYSVYLFHTTALNFFPRPAAVLITLAYSTAMWFLVEKPILNFKVHRADPAGVTLATK